MPAPKWDGRDPLFGVAFHPKDPVLAVGAPQYEGSIDVWALEPPRELQRLDGHRGQVRFCAWGPGGKFLVSVGTRDGTVRLWDMTTPKPTGKAIALGSTQARGAALSPEGRYLATANADGTIYLRRLVKADESPGTVLPKTRVTTRK